LHSNIEAFLQQGKRGGQTDRQRNQIRETTPDASGNVLHLLEWIIFATKHHVETLHATSSQRVETSSNECNALQRTAGRLYDWK